MKNITSLKNDEEHKNKHKFPRKMNLNTSFTFLTGNFIEDRFCIILKKTTDDGNADNDTGKALMLINVVFYQKKKDTLFMSV